MCLHWRKTYSFYLSAFKFPNSWWKTSWLQILYAYESMHRQGSFLVDKWTIYRLTFQGYGSNIRTLTSSCSISFLLGNRYIHSVWNRGLYNGHLDRNSRQCMNHDRLTRYFWHLIRWFLILFHQCTKVSCTCYTHWNWHSSSSLLQKFQYFCMGWNPNYSMLILKKMSNLHLFWLPKVTLCITDFFHHNQRSLNMIL